MRFDLQTLTDYSDDAMLAELRRVAAIIPHGKIKRSDFDRVSKVHSSTLHNRFGTWRKALIAAGLAERFDDSSEAWSREEVVDCLQSVARSIGRNHVTKQELAQHARISC